MDDLREKLAKALRKASSEKAGWKRDWEDASEPMRDHWRAQADAALAVFKEWLEGGETREQVYAVFGAHFNGYENALGALSVALDSLTKDSDT